MNLTFNHEAETLSKSINMDENDVIYTKKALIFSILSPKVLSDLLYDDADDAPSNMLTVSGRLELGLSLLNNDNMKFYYLYNFNEIYNKLVEMYVIYKNPEKIEKLIKENSSGLDMALKNLMVQIKIKPMKDLVEIIEKSNGDFSKFIENTKNLVLDPDDLSTEEDEE